MPLPSKFDGAAGPLAHARESSGRSVAVNAAGAAVMSAASSATSACPRKHRLLTMVGSLIIDPLVELRASANGADLVNGK